MINQIEEYLLSEFLHTIANCFIRRLRDLYRFIRTENLTHSTRHIEFEGGKLIGEQKLEQISEITSEDLNVLCISKLVLVILVELSDSL